MTRRGKKRTFIEAQARQILDVARGALAKMGVAEASIIDVLLDGHPAEGLDGMRGATQST